MFTRDLVYLIVVGIIVAAAFFESFLWLGAFLYCLVKVFRKAENASTRVLAVVMAIIFTLWRYSGLPNKKSKLRSVPARTAFVPVMFATVPLPEGFTYPLPPREAVALQWFAFWSFSSLLTVSWLLVIYQLITHPPKQTQPLWHLEREETAPKIIVVVPCYKEPPDVLLRTVDSIVDSEYPTACLHTFLSFDGDEEDSGYLGTLSRLGVPPVRESGFPQSIDVRYRGTRITISRFTHGGKRHCQKKTFRLIERIYRHYFKYHKNVYVLFVDSDCMLDKLCIQHFMHEMDSHAKDTHPMVAMTGIITATTENSSLITFIQDMEYIHGQLFERSAESGCGAVTCLPGALTMIRYSTFKKLAEYYFADKAEQCHDLFDYGKCYLGEDRWLTHLLLVSAPSAYQIGLSTSCFCKTEAVQTFHALLKQRRRWFLGFVTNEVCMLTDKRLWRRYPFLCLLRVAQNSIRTTALLFFIMIVSLAVSPHRAQDLPIGFVLVLILLNWCLMAYIGISMKRYKIVLYPGYFFLGPVFNWIFLVYGIFTAGHRTWGGPRTDAAHENANNTPEEAVELGRHSNIVHASFSTKADTRTIFNIPEAPLIPLNARIRSQSSTSSSSDLPGQFDGQAHASDMGTQSRPISPTKPNQRYFWTQRTSTEQPDVECASHNLRKSRKHPPLAQSAFFAVQNESHQSSGSASAERDYSSAGTADQSSTLEASKRTFRKQVQDMLSLIKLAR